MKKLFFGLAALCFAFAGTPQSEDALLKSIELSDKALFKHSLNSSNIDYMDAQGQSIQDIIETKLISDILTEQEELELISMLKTLKSFNSPTPGTRKKQKKSAVNMKHLNPSKKDAFWDRAGQNLNMTGHRTKGGKTKVYLYENPKLLKTYIENRTLWTFLDIFDTPAKISISLDGAHKKNLKEQWIEKDDFEKKLFAYSEETLIESSKNRLHIKKGTENFKLTFKTKYKTDILANLKKFALGEILSLDEAKMEEVLGVEDINFLEIAITKKIKEIRNSNSLMDIEILESEKGTTFTLILDKLYNKFGNDVHLANVKKMLKRENRDLTKSHREITRLFRTNGVSRVSCSLAEGEDIFKTLLGKDFSGEDCKEIRINGKPYPAAEIFY